MKVSLLAAITAAVLLVAAASHSKPPAPPVSYSATAYAIGFSDVSVLGKPIADETLGSLLASGGSLSAPRATLTLPGGMGTLTVGGAKVYGAFDTDGATDTVNRLDLLPKLTVRDVRPLCLPLLGCVTRLVAAGGGPVELLDIALAHSAASTSSTHPAAHTISTQVGAITLLGGAVKVPLSAAPDTTVNLGLLSITLNQGSYNPSTNTASAQAVVLHFPADGQLAPAITGTITIASSTASAG